MLRFNNFSQLLLKYSFVIHDLLEILSCLHVTVYTYPKSDPWKRLTRRLHFTLFMWWSIHMYKLSFNNIFTSVSEFPNSVLLSTTIYLLSVPSYCIMYHNLQIFALDTDQIFLGKFELHGNYSFHLSISHLFKWQNWYFLKQKWNFLKISQHWALVLYIQLREGNSAYFRHLMSCQLLGM